MKDLATRAKERDLKPEEYQGGSAAISNLGMYGIATCRRHQSAARDHPGRRHRRATSVVRAGKIEIATQMTVTLSSDHRAVDGALGAVLIGAFKALIENPVMMLV